MASRYWVAGGTGNWNSTTNWAATSGGASGASFPVNVDDAFVDALSGTSPTITINVNSQVLSLNFTGAITPTFTGSSSLNVFGSLTRIAAMTWTWSGALAFNSALAGKTVTSAGGTYIGDVGFSNGGGWTLLDALNLPSKNLSLGDGTLDTNGMAVSFSTFTLSGTTVRTLTLGASILTCAGSWNAAVTTNLTLNAGTSKIIMSGSTKTFDGGGLTYNNLDITGTPITITGANTFNVVTIGAGKTLKLTSATSQTITSLVSGGTGVSYAVLQSVTAASAATISTASTISLTFISVQDITRTGAGTISVLNGTNVSGNTGITFTSVRYWIAGTGNTNTTASWAYSSGGASGAAIPTSVDSVYFDANSFNGAGQTVTVNAAFNCLDLDWTGATNFPTFAGSSAVNIYGSRKYIAAMSATYSGTMTFKSTTTGKTITTSGLSLADSMTFDGVGGEWILQDNLTTVAGNITLTNGALNTNGKNFTFNAFNSSNSNVRSLILGSSTLTCAFSWTVSNSTNFTLTAGTSTINVAGSGTRNFNGGGLIYYNVTLTTATTYNILGNNTFNILTISAGRTVNLTSGTTQTVTDLVCNGTTAAPSTLQSVTAASAATIALPAGRRFIRHTSAKDITISGVTSLTDIAGTNVSGNTGITFVTKFEMGRIKNDGSFNWYSSATGTSAKVSG